MCVCVREGVRLAFAVGLVRDCRVEFRCADGIVVAVSSLCLQSWLMQLQCDVQGDDGRSNWAWFVKVILGGWNNT